MVFDSDSLNDLHTGGKATVNALAGAVVSTATLGINSDYVAWDVTQDDLARGYGTANMIGRVSSELLAGVATGAAGKLGKLGKAVAVADTFANGYQTGQGLHDMAENGIGFGNSLQVVGGAVGLGGNIAGAMRVGTRAASGALAPPPSRSLDEMAESVGDLNPSAGRAAGGGVSSGDIAARRAYLNKKFGRTGNLDQDIMSRQAALYDRLVMQHVSGSGKTQLGVFKGVKENYIMRGERLGRSYFDIGDYWYKIPKADRWRLNERFLKHVTDSGDQIFFNIPLYDIGPQNKYSLLELRYLRNKTDYQWLNQWSLGRRK